MHITDSYNKWFFQLLTGTSKRKSIKFESDLLKTNEDIALQSHRILQTHTALYMVGGKFVSATAIQTTVKFCDFVKQNLCFIWMYHLQSC